MGGVNGTPEICVLPKATKWILLENILAWKNVRNMNRFELLSW
jgi:hypothetical protein